MADLATDDNSDNNEQNPWVTLLVGLAIIGFGIGLFFYFNHLEQEGGRVRMNAIVLLIYNFMGKMGVLITLSIFGGLVAIVGIKELISGPKEK